MKRAARPAQRIYTLADLAAIAPQLARHFVEAPHAGPGAPCWLWTGARSYRNGKPARPKNAYWLMGKRETLPYRQTYTLLTGQLILPGLQYCHSECHNAFCGQPAHGGPGTQGDNTAQRRTYEARLRAWKQEQTPCAT